MSEWFGKLFLTQDDLKGKTTKKEEYLIEQNAEYMLKVL
jgi:hypothetical protein